MAQIDTTGCLAPPASATLTTWTPPASQRYRTRYAAFTDSSRRGSTPCPWSRDTTDERSGMARFRCSPLPATRPRRGPTRGRTDGCREIDAFTSCSAHPPSTARRLRSGWPSRSCRNHDGLGPKPAVIAHEPTREDCHDNPEYERSPVVGVKHRSHRHSLLGGIRPGVGGGRFAQRGVAWREASMDGEDGEDRKSTR